MRVSDHCTNRLFVIVIELTVMRVFKKMLMRKLWWRLLQNIILSHLKWASLNCWWVVLNKMLLRELWWRFSQNITFSHCKWASWNSCWSKFKLCNSKAQNMCYLKMITVCWMLLNLTLFQFVFCKLSHLLLWLIVSRS